MVHYERLWLNSTKIFLFLFLNLSPVPRCWLLLYFSVSISAVLYRDRDCYPAACLVLTSLALEMCLEKWLRFETATADSYSHIKLQPFPQLTVCPAQPYKLEVLRAHGVSEVSDIQFNAEWTSNDTDIRSRPCGLPSGSYLVVSAQRNFTLVWCIKWRSWCSISRWI